MGFSCGIVGLPNVGKSSLFNALTKGGAESSNYPFCTIDPNVGTVAVPDERLDKIVSFVKPKSIVPTYMNFTDIAGLVKGASEGQGLGNQFLAHIREVEAIVQVVRLFKDEDIVHIDELDPIRDIEIIMTELRLKDMDTIENRKRRIEKETRSGSKTAKEEFQFIQNIEQLVSEEKPTHNLTYSPNELEWLKDYRLLTFKPMIILANVSEDELTTIEENPLYQKLLNYTNERQIEVLPISAKIEEEIGALPEEEAKEFLESMGLEESGLNRLIKRGYELLNLITYFTAGEKECRGWTIPVGTSAPKAAGKIHSDFEKGFIRAEIVSYDEFIKVDCNYAKVKENGKLRVEGKDYIIQDGDVVHFRFNV